MGSIGTIQLCRTKLNANDNQSNDDDDDDDLEQGPGPGSRVRPDTLLRRLIGSLLLCFFAPLVGANVIYYHHFSSLDIVARAARIDSSPGLVGSLSAAPISSRVLEQGAGRAPSRPSSGGDSIMVLSRH